MESRGVIEEERKLGVEKYILLMKGSLLSKIVVKRKVTSTVQTGKN